MTDKQAHDAIMHMSEAAGKATTAVHVLHEAVHIHVQALRSLANAAAHAAAFHGSEVPSAHRAAADQRYAENLAHSDQTRRAYEAAHRNADAATAQLGLAGTVDVHTRTTETAMTMALGTVWGHAEQTLDQARRALSSGAAAVDRQLHNRDDAAARDLTSLDSRVRDLMTANHNTQDSGQAAHEVYEREHPHRDHDQHPHKHQPRHPDQHRDQGPRGDAGGTQPVPQGTERPASDDGQPSQGVVAADMPVAGGTGFADAERTPVASAADAGHPGAPEPPVTEDSAGAPAEIATKPGAAGSTPTGDAGPTDRPEAGSADRHEPGTDKQAATGDGHGTEKQASTDDWHRPEKETSADDGHGGEKHASTEDWHSVEKHASTEDWHGAGDQPAPDSGPPVAPPDGGPG